MFENGKPHNTILEMNTRHYDILGISEMRWRFSSKMIEDVMGTMMLIIETELANSQQANWSCSNNFRRLLRSSTTFTTSRSLCKNPASDKSEKK